MSGAGDMFKELASAMSLGLIESPVEKRKKKEEEMELMAQNKPKPKTAPVADDEAAKRQSMRDMQRRYAGKGRAATMLSGNSNLG